ncbi:MAG: signal recognition particle-docking protein FtsY [Candidatus Aminicenantes bacterium]|nr:MAG: signal recognition particle-docking protein FtsY [Candidatus Aminicenantes bacterium]
MLNLLKKNLSRTRTALKERLTTIFSSNRNREEILQELEESLLLADIGWPTTEKIIKALRQNSPKTASPLEIESLLKKEILTILKAATPEALSSSEKKIIMVVGINGGGKTTSVAKLAHYYSNQGQKVLLVAADTFRAAAQEQLAIWAERLGLPLIKGQYGADPAAVVYDALQSFKAKNYDVCLIDTAGRLHTNRNLMGELEKIRRVIAREFSGAPHEILLVLDASLGQNALIQAQEFYKFSGLTGIFLAKLDGTAKGGCVISIADQLHLPIKFVGVGERENDYLLFSPEDFVDALLS